MLELGSLDRNGKMAHFFWSSLTANSELDNIAYFSCFMHIDSQSTQLGMFSFVFQGKNLSETLLSSPLRKRKKEERSTTAFFFLVLSPCKLCKSKLEKLMFIYGKEDVTCLKVAGGGWFWFWFVFYF